MLRHAAFLVCCLGVCDFAAAQQPLYGSPYGGYTPYAPAPACNCPNGVCNAGAAGSQTICGPGGCYRATPQPGYNAPYNPRYIPSAHSTYRYPVRPSSGTGGIFPFNVIGNLFRSRSPQPAYSPPVYSAPGYSAPGYGPAPWPTYPVYPGSADAPLETGTFH